MWPLVEPKLIQLIIYRKCLMQLLRWILVFIVTDKYGTTDFDSIENELVFAFMNGQDNKFERFFFIGGGADKDEYTDSLAMPANYDSPYVQIVHGQLGESSQLVGRRYRWWPSIYHAFKVVGRTAGKEPQVPITNKTIGVDKLKHTLTKIEKEKSFRCWINCNCV